MQYLIGKEKIHETGISNWTKNARRGGIHKIPWYDYWKLHADLVSSKCKLLIDIRGMKQVLLPKMLRANYYALIDLILLIVLRCGVTRANRSWAEWKKIQKKVVWCVEKAHYLEHTMPLLQKLHILKFHDVCELQILKQMYLYFHNMTPQPIRKLFVRNEEVHPFNIKQGSKPRVHKWNKALGKKIVTHMGTPSLVRKKCRVAEHVWY